MVYGYQCPKCGVKEHSAPSNYETGECPACYKSEDPKFVVGEVTPTDSYMAHATLCHESGIDSVGNKCQREWTPGYVAGHDSGTHDGIRDGVSRGFSASEMVAGAWRRS